MQCSILMLVHSSFGLCQPEKLRWSTWSSFLMHVLQNNCFASTLEFFANFSEEGWNWYESNHYKMVQIGEMESLRPLRLLSHGAILVKINLWRNVTVSEHASHLRYGTLVRHYIIIIRQENLSLCVYMHTLSIHCWQNSLFDRFWLHQPS
jgi:hypothetical protein